MELQVNVILQVWRQDSPDSQGGFQTYQVDEVSDEMSFLEMLDLLNERLLSQGEDPIAFDHDWTVGRGSVGPVV